MYQTSKTDFTQLEQCGLKPAMPLMKDHSIQERIISKPGAVIETSMITVEENLAKGLTIARPTVDNPKITSVSTPRRFIEAGERLMLELKHKQELEQNKKQTTRLFRETWHDVGVLVIGTLLCMAAAFQVPLLVWALWCTVLLWHFCTRGF